MKLTLEVKSMLVHILIGGIIGFISSQLHSNYIVLMMMLVVLLATGQLTQYLLKIKTTEEGKKYDRKWWLSNGGWQYVTFWLLTWILFLNI